MSIPEAVKKYAQAQAGSIYKWNSPRAIGYLFTVHNDRRQVATGMFCDSKDEIEPERWDGLLLFGGERWLDHQFYDLTNERQVKALNKKLNLELKPCTS